MALPIDNFDIVQLLYNNYCYVWITYYNWYSEVPSAIKYYEPLPLLTYD